MLTVNQLPTESVEILLKVPKIIITKNHYDSNTNKNNNNNILAILY